MAAAAAAREELIGGPYVFHPDRRHSRLGEGAFGRTYRMRNEADESLYAVKWLNIDRLTGAGVPIDMIKGEARTMLRMRHENVVRYFGAFFSQ